MTAYYILAPAFGAFAVLLFLAGRFTGWSGEKFPGKFYLPIILVCVLFAASTLTAAIWGGINHKQHLKHEKQAKAAESHKE
jgi:hypothetical protein